MTTPAPDTGRAAEEIIRKAARFPLPGGYYRCQHQPHHRTCSLHRADGLHIGNMLSEHAAEFADALKAAETEAAHLRAENARLLERIRALTPEPQEAGDGR